MIEYIEKNWIFNLSPRLTLAEMLFEAMRCHPRKFLRCARNADIIVSDPIRYCVIDLLKIVHLRIQNIA